MLLFAGVPDPPFVAAVILFVRLSADGNTRDRAASAGTRSTASVAFRGANDVAAADTVARVSVVAVAMSPVSLWMGSLMMLWPVVLR